MGRPIQALILPYLHHNGSDCPKNRLLNATLQDVFQRVTDLCLLRRHEKLLLDEAMEQFNGLWSRLEQRNAQSNAGKQNINHREHYE